MRIVYVTSTMPFGKKEAFVIPEVKELIRQGHEVLVVPTFPRGGVLHGDVAPLMENVVARPLVSPSVLAGALEGFAGAPRRSAQSLAWILGSRTAGMLARNLSVYPKGLWLAGVAKAWGAEHIHAHWATVPATLALVAGTVSRIPWSVTAHRFDIAEDNLLAVKAREASFLRAIDRQGAAEISATAGPGAPAPVVIHMGVDLPENGEALPPVALCEGREAGGVNRVVIAANLVEKKGHADLLEAMRLLAERGVSEIRVDFAGDGPLKAKLAASAERLGVADRVSFLGMLPHERLLARLRAGEWGMLVLPSIVTDSGEKEGIPVALIEAMGIGVPVVSTTTGGIPELFEGVADPPLVPPGDPEALADEMERVISDPDRRDRLVREGRARVEESFATPRIAAELSRRFAGSSGRPEGQPQGRPGGRMVLLTQFLPPETNAGARRVGPMAEAFARRYDLLVAALRPSYPSPRDHDPSRLADHDARLPYAASRPLAFHPHKGSLPLRTAREAIMASRLALRALREAPATTDVVVASSPSMFLGPAGLLLARATGARFVWDVRDLTWGYAAEVAGGSRFTALAARALERFMRAILRRADLVVGASDGISEAVVGTGVKPDRVVTAPNGISGGLLEEVSRAASGRLPEGARPGRRPVVAYAGVIGYNQGLGTVVEAARLLPGVDFVLAGDGPELGPLEEKARRLGARNVAFEGYLDREGLLEVYRRSDVLLAHVRSTPTIDATMVPVKLFEYMAAGRPIVYAGRGLAASLLREIGCAEVVSPGCPGAVAEAIGKLLRDPGRMRELAQKGAARARRDFRREEIMERLTHELGRRFGAPVPEECAKQTETEAHA